MESLAVLLDRLMAARGLSSRQLAKKVGRSDEFVRLVRTGKRAPYHGDGPRWAAALGLRGDEREQFLDAVAIAASPPRAQEMIARLKRRRSE